MEGGRELDDSNIVLSCFSCETLCLSRKMNKSTPIVTAYQMAPKTDEKTKKRWHLKSLTGIECVELCRNISYLSLWPRSEDSIMAVVPDVTGFKCDESVQPVVRVPLFLVRVDGVIYNTGMSLTYNGPPHSGHYPYVKTRILPNTW